MSVITCSQGHQNPTGYRFCSYCGVSLQLLEPLHTPAHRSPLGAYSAVRAWKSRQWRSVSEFKAHQRAWAIAGWLIVGITAIAILVIFGLLLLLWIFSSGIMD